MYPLRRTCAPHEPPLADAILDDLDRLYAGAVYLTLDGASAEELVERTVALALADPERCPAPFRQWDVRLRATMCKLCGLSAGLSHARVASACPGQIASDMAGFTDAQLAAMGDLPDAAVRGALLTLPAAYRMAVFYGDVEGRPAEVIAEIMGVPPDLGCAYQRRGRLALANLLLNSAGAGN